MPPQTACCRKEGALEHIAAYVAKFLVGDPDAETAVLHTDGRFADPTAEWIDWETPELR